MKLLVLVLLLLFASRLPVDVFSRWKPSLLL
jgi:hypothetical protein